MNIFHRFHHHATLLASVVLLSASLAAHADDMQDANKLFKQGQHSQAMDKVNNYLAGKPKDAQARFLKGLILTEQSKVDDAIKIFTGLTEDFPELPEPYNNLAVLYASQNHYDKAKLALEMAIRTHPSYATAHENLGDIYAKMASQAYDRALQLDRSNTATKTKLAMIQDLFAGGTRGKTTAARGAVAPAKVAASKPEPAKTEPVASKPAPAEKVAETPPAAAPAEKVAEASPAAPAAASPSEKVAESAPAADSSEVLNSVHAWIAAWSAKDVKNYLSSYAADFKTPAGESRADWEAMRSERISKPKSIQVSISKPSVKFTDSTHATVTFKQSYSASHLKTSGNKTLMMVKADGKWLIQEEHSK